MRFGVAKTPEDLHVYQRALEASAAISAIIQRLSFSRDLRLRDNLAYLYRSRGSARETRTHLITARDRRHISEDERVSLTAKFEEIGKMATGLIRHLESENRKHRR
jgi:four helix bundle protein